MYRSIADIESRNCWPMTQEVDSVSSSKRSTLKIGSWNVCGLQSVLRTDSKGVKHKQRIDNNVLDNWLHDEEIDIACLQETRCKPEVSWKPPATRCQPPFANLFLHHQVHQSEHKSTTTAQPTTTKPRAYTTYAHYCTDKPGYSGTMIATRIPVIKRQRGFPVGYLENEKDQEGRVIALEFAQFHLVNVYAPSTGHKPAERSLHRSRVWEPALRKYIARLQETNKPVILVGDLNVIPDTQLDVSADMTWMSGAKDEVRKNHQLLLSQCKLVDSYRHLFPTERRYSWAIPSKSESRTTKDSKKNCNTSTSGSRLDFCLVSENLKPQIASATIHDDRFGSDHFPVSVSVSFFNNAAADVSEIIN